MANDPWPSAVDWKLKENGSQPPRQMPHVSVNILIYCLNEHRVIFLAWNAHLELQPPKIPLLGYGTETQWVLSPSYVCPQAGSVSGKVNGAFSGAKRAKRHSSRLKYYPNSVATFQLLMCAGDIASNPGPALNMSKNVCCYLSFL